MPSKRAGRRTSAVRVIQYHAAASWVTGTERSNSSPPAGQPRLALDGPRAARAAALRWKERRRTISPGCDANSACWKSDDKREHGWEISGNPILPNSLKPHLGQMANYMIDCAEGVSIRREPPGERLHVRLMSDRIARG